MLTLWPAALVNVAAVVIMVKNAMLSVGVSCTNVKKGCPDLFETEIGIEAVAVIRALSVATTVSTCFPFLTWVVSHRSENCGANTLPINVLFGEETAPIKLPSTRNTTELIPLPPLTSADTSIVPEAPVFAPGEIIVTVKPAGGELLFTVTATDDEEIFPARSEAVAVTVCEPLLDPVVSQEAEYGGLVSLEPTAFPSTLKLTKATLTLSVALAMRLTVPATVELCAGDITDTVGGVVSGAPLLVTWTVIQDVPVFLARSVATALMRC